MNQRRRFLAFICAVAFALWSPLSVEQAWAQGSVIRLVVPFPAGGAADVITRLVAPGLSANLKQPVIVENRLGATGSIAAEHVAKSAPDGHTILVGSSSLMTANPNLSKDLRYDPLKDFVPLGMLGTADVILSIHPSVPVHSVKELVAYAKQNPGKLTYASSGVGSTLHLGTEYFSQQAGIQLTHVPYKGEAPAAQDLVGGHVRLMMLNSASAGPLIQTGKVRPLGIASLARHPDYPNVPTIAEAGFPGFQSTIWIGLFLPAGTPPSVVDRLHGALAVAMSDEEVRERTRKVGMQPVTSTPKELADRVRADLEKWAGVVREAGIKPN